MMHRRSLLAAMVFAPLARAQAQGTGPAAPIQAFLTALAQSMKAGPFAKRADILRPAILASFDLPALLQATVGPRWASFEPDAKTRLVEAFTAFTVASWTANFDADNGETFEILPDRRQVGTDEVVATRILPKSGEPTRLDYVMRETPAGWRVVDILVNGAISRVAVQRSDFRSLLTTGKPEPLIDMLTQKAALLAVGGP